MLPLWHKVNPKDTQPRFSIEIRGEERAGEVFIIGLDGLLVGRSSSCNVILESREVSRRHCYFYVDGPACYVMDLGSRNGTFVNGIKVKQTRLRAGDVVDIGPARLVLKVEEKSASPLKPFAFAWIGDVLRQRAGLPTPRHPLALLSLVFSLLTYIHWAFGIGAVILALLALYEVRGNDLATTALAAGGLALGAVGGTLNLWFAEAVPQLYAQEIERARLECLLNLSRIGSAIQSYRAKHGGAFPPILSDLVRKHMLTPAELKCPGCALDKWAEPCPYLYFNPDATPAGTHGGVVACDCSLTNHQGKGGWVLWRDGTVEWLGQSQFETVLARTALGDKRCSASPIHSSNQAEP